MCSSDLTAGHASHHFSFMLENKKIMFCGDSVGMFIPGLNAMVPTTPHPYRMESGIESINQMIERSPDKLAFAHHAIKSNAIELMHQHINQLESWKVCVADCLSKGIESEEDIALEISKIDEHSEKIFRDKGDFGGIRRALVSSIPGFKFIILKENNP